MIHIYPPLASLQGRAPQINNQGIVSTDSVTVWNMASSLST
jgi:hypothetical protein